MSHGLQMETWRRAPLGHWLLGLGLLLLVSLGLTLWLGPVRLGWPGHLDPLAEQILWQIRWPRAWMAILLGAGLASSGCILQTLLHNPLAEPGLIGVSGGASMCAVLALVLTRLAGAELPLWGLSSAAFGGAMLMTLILLGLTRGQRLDSARLLLLGVALGIGAGAVTTWLLFLANDTSVREILFWMMGSLSYSQDQSAWWAIPYLLSLGWLLWRRDAFTLLQLGEQHAQLLGVNLKRLRWQLILVVALLSGVAVAMAGAIGFIGLLVPHLMRLLTRQGVALVLPASALAGGIVLLWADWLARTLFMAGELPVGVVTATLGAPLLIYLLVTRHA